jgi:hypothetical protein
MFFVEAISKSGAGWPTCALSTADAVDDMYPPKLSVRFPSIGDRGPPMIAIKYL